MLSSIFAIVVVYIICICNIWKQTLNSFASYALFALFSSINKNSTRSIQGRIQDFVLGGAKVGEGSADRLRSPAGPGQSRGGGGASPPGNPGF